MISDSVLKDRELGDVYISRRANMLNITARWRNDGLYVNAPIRMPLNTIKEGIEALRERLVKNKPTPLRYHSMMVINCFKGVKVTILSDENLGRSISCSGSQGVYYIKVGGGLDFDDFGVTQAISKMLCRMMSSVAGYYLIPRAKELALSLSLTPNHFEIGRGLRKLGHCTPAGVIQISANVMFLSDELVDYIIYHELAHLTEMNHSARFHQLCNSYCNGREKELEGKLRGFKWSVLK